MKIRNMCYSDIEQLAEIFDDKKSFSTIKFHEMNDKSFGWVVDQHTNGSPLFVVYENNDIIGFSLVTDWLAFTENNKLSEHLMFVRASRYNDGIDDVLLRASINYARHAGKELLILRMSPKYASKIDFYEQMGFEKIAFYRKVSLNIRFWNEMVIFQFPLNIK